jgi:hypothetical protein
MKNSEEQPPRCRTFQTRLPNQLQRLAVPVAAELLRVPLCSSVLPSSKPIAIAAAMLQEKDLSLRTTNPSHFLKRPYWIWESAGGQRRNDGVETIVLKSEIFCVHQQKKDILGCLRRAFLCDAQHLAADVDGDHPTVTRIIDKVLSRSDCHFQRCPRRSSHQSPAERAQSQEVGNSNDPIVPPGKPVVLLSDFVRCERRHRFSVNR